MATIEATEMEFVPSYDQMDELVKAALLIGASLDNSGLPFKVTLTSSGLVHLEERDG